MIPFRDSDRRVGTTVVLKVHTPVALTGPNTTVALVAERSVPKLTMACTPTKSVRYGRWSGAR